jgi:hypothetical protein
MQKVAPDFIVQRSDVVLDVPPAAATATSGAPASRLAAWLARATDAQLAMMVGVVLFALAAWPVALVKVPPLQDLPNHLAAISIIEHPARYPQFVFNGFLKTNSALFTWVLLTGRVVGLLTAARLFVLVVLALGALAIPRFVLAFGGRRRMVVASFFAWPMVHNWFVSMGMLDFALSVPLATFLLVMLEAQRVRPTVARGIGIAALSVLTWHAHVFPLLVVGLLVAFQVVLAPTWKERLTRARWLALPFAPACLLVARSLWAQMIEPVGDMTGGVDLGRLLPPWELFYNMWAEWFYAFTWLEIATLVPCIGMGLWAIYRWRDRVPFFGPLAVAALAAAYAFTPYTATNWFHVNSRFLPFLWLAALVRLPEHLPRKMMVGLGACAVTYSLGMGCDYVRLDRDVGRFTAGIGVVPEGATLLPLIFRAKGTSENTRTLLHAWGYYVVQKQTSAPLLFAHSRSFPIMYRDPPPLQFNHLVLESFAPSMASPDWACSVLRSGGVAVDDCDAMWRTRWAAFWRSAEPQFDHVLLWSAPKEVMSLVPADYRVSFQRDELTILERRPGPVALASGQEP